MNPFGWTNYPPFRDHMIPFLLVYYAPVLIGAYRRTQAKAKSAPVWVLLLVCVLTGWTVIGWLYTLRLAFRSVELPWDGLLSGGGGGGGGGGGQTTGWTPPAEAGSQRHPCPSCSGSGGSYCTWCQGRGHWMENTTAMHCQQCGGSGRLTCQSCRGSGWAQ